MVPRRFSLQALADAVKASGLAVAPHSPWAELPWPSPTSSRPHLADASTVAPALTVLCAPERRVTVSDPLHGHHTFFIAKGTVAQCWASERDLLLPPTETEETLLTALVGRATHSGGLVERVLVASPEQTLLMTALYTTWRGATMERRNVEAKFGGPQLVSGLVELGALVAKGTSVEIVAGWKELLAARASNSVLTLEGYDYRSGHEAKAICFGPVGQRWTASDLQIEGRTLTVFAALNEQAARTWLGEQFLSS